MEFDYQLQTTRVLLLSLYTAPYEDKELHQSQVKHYTKKFKALLAQKARQKVVNDMGNHDCSKAENTSTSNADDPRPRICIRNILKKKIAWCR